MGFRTVFVFQNDAICGREDFLKKADALYDAIVSAGRIQCGLGQVVEQVHNDNVTLRTFGGGSGLDQRVASTHWNDETPELSLLKQYAARQGYRVSRIPKKS